MLEETPLAYLLRRLREDGRDDLIEDYHRQNRRYQRSIRLRDAGLCVDRWRESLETAEGKHHEYAAMQLAKAKAALDKLEREREI